mgnify:CR=1 FL=1
MEIEYIKDVVRNYVTKIIKSPSMPEYNSLLTDIGIDSVKIIELVIYIESKFNFEFDPENLNYITLRSIDSISEYIYKKLYEI